MASEPADGSIAGNAALVTASSSGLGKAAAAALVGRGANVVVNGRDADRLDDAVAELGAAGPGSAVGFVGDLTDPADVEGLVERTIEEFDGLDHVVTSAGGPPSGEFMETTDEDWYDAFDLLVMSVVRTVRAAAPALRADGGGTIVTITSRSVKEAIPGIVLSNAVRMGVIGLGKTLSREFAPEVRVNSVLPGPHETARSDELHRDRVERGEYDSYDAAVADTADDIPLDRIGAPAELGEVVAFLSSEESSFITGVAIPVDGGAGASNL
jgi:NAD(P)-dependent dehydrogenase (short-subunit alcohol dehydrogenase family)